MSHRCLRQCRLIYEISVVLFLQIGGVHLNGDPVITLKSYDTKKTAVISVDKMKTLMKTFISYEITFFKSYQMITFRLY